MKVTDLEILAIIDTLQHESGMTTVRIARLIRLTESAARKRLEALQASGLLTGDHPPRTGQGNSPIYWRIKK